MDTISLISHVTIGLVIAATLVVVFLTVCRTMLTICGRRTAVALALGVTTLTTIGTTQVIFVTPVASPPSSSLPVGGALLFGFISLAVADLLTKLLLAAATMTPAMPAPSLQNDDGEIVRVGLQAQSSKQGASSEKRHGRRSRRSPDLSEHGPLNDLNKSDASKQPKAAVQETTSRQWTDKSTP